MTSNDCRYGKRLIPRILDDVAQRQPNRVLYTLVDAASDPPGFQHVSAAAFARAVNKTAWWLCSSIGTHSAIRPLGYIGPHDLRHVLLTYAAVKAGCTALFLSPKNNIEGALAVLEAANCNIWIKPGAKTVPLVKSILNEHPMEVLQLPDLCDLLDMKSETELFPYVKTFEEAATEPFCMLHTSGTTGNPKPISWTNALISTMDAVRLLPAVEGDYGLAPWTSIWHEGDTIYSSFPMSHGAGIIMDILMPSLFGLRCVLGPADVLPNMNLVNLLAEHADIDIWSMVPSLVDELGETPDVLANFKGAKFICASGGPVSPDIAGKVNDVVRILNLTGTTEGLFIGNLVVDREDWHWFAFHPYSGFEFREIEPGVYEHWVHRTNHWSLFQGIFHTFADKDSINLKDLYVRHPSKPNLWAFKGRSDDVVVLSNGYKISPLSTEAYISTHAAIHGCLVIGTGKSQAGLLIELKEGVTRNNELFDSILEIVEKSNELSSTKNRLLRNYIAFAEPERPFVRTDKGTVKRHATLVLYADFIERFYDSREEELEAVAVDTSSAETIVQSLRDILGAASPEIRKAGQDEDLFDLGLDSLSVFRAINIIRVAMKLRDKLAPRHLYATPTLARFAALLARMSQEGTAHESSGAETSQNAEPAKLKRMIAEQKARLSFKMNPFDYMNANHYMGLNIFFPLQEGVSAKDTFEWLQHGLHRTLQLIPALDGKMMRCSEQEIGFKKGDLRLTIPPYPEATYEEPRQLAYKDLSKVMPSFATLRKDGFLPSAVDDDLVLPCSPFPLYPADVVVAQANFIDGGCILAANFHHGCLDAVGVMVAMKVWAESCRYIAGDVSATCDWLDPESFNHSLPEILHDLDERRGPISGVDPGVWGFLPFVHPAKLETMHLTNGNVVHNKTRQSPNEQRPVGRSVEIGDSGQAVKRALPEPPVWSYQLGWPPAPDAAGRSLRTVMFLVPPEKLKLLQQEVMADPAAKGAITSISDILQAFFWRVAIRARYRVATDLHGKAFDASEPAILELPIDSRPYFSQLLPSTYMGSMLILNRPTMAVKELCSPVTSIGHVAYVLREAAARITPSLVSDVFTVLRSLPQYDPEGQFSLADMGLESMHAMISNMILFEPREISFGESFFANGGSPEALRPQIERGGRRFRFLVIHPMRPDGGVELVLGTLPEELEMLRKDDELMKYARLVDW